MFNWVTGFLLGRQIQVRVGVEHSKMYTVENGTPQGTVCSPILFNIMINDIFEGVESTIGKSLNVDDGALWARGRNQKYLKKKMQKAIRKVEEWTHKWGFKMSVAKSQVICFARQHKQVPEQKISGKYI